MKKYIPVLVAALLVSSCSKTDIQNSTSTIGKADSLFTTAKDGFKTLDSISKSLKDSTKTGGIPVPDLQKHKDDALESIRNKAKNIDSVNSEIEKLKDKIGNSAETMRTVDSARQVLENSQDPVEILTTITKTVDKISRQNKSTDTRPQSQNEPRRKVEQPTPSEENVLPQADPLVKTASISMSVDDIYTNKKALQQELNSYGGEIVSESFGEEEGIRKHRVLAKVPYRFFNEVSANISQNLGILVSKEIETQGSEPSPNQMCDLELTFSEKTTTNNGLANNDTGVKNYDAGDAFSKGFKNFGKVMVWLLPFWPFLLIGLIIWYFVARSRRKKREAEVLRMQQEIEVLKQQAQKEATPTAPTPNTQQPAQPNDDPYSRFMPK